MRGARNVMRDNVKREMQSSADLFTFHASRITFPVSPITFHASRFTYHIAFHSLATTGIR
jgi:hypothetical protein